MQRINDDKIKQVNDVQVFPIFRILSKVPDANIPWNEKDDESSIHQMALELL